MFRFPRNHHQATNTKQHNIISCLQYLVDKPKGNLKLRVTNWLSQSGSELNSKSVFTFVILSSLPYRSYQRTEKNNFLWIPWFFYVHFKAAGTSMTKSTFTVYLSHGLKTNLVYFLWMGYSALRSIGSVPRRRDLWCLTPERQRNAYKTKASPSPLAG